MAKKRRKTRTHVSHAAEALHSTQTAALSGGQVSAETSVPRVAVVRHLAGRRQRRKSKSGDGGGDGPDGGGKNKMEPEVARLMEDTRQLFCPYTALHLRPPSDLRAGNLADYAGKLHSGLGVSHLLSYGQTGARVTMRLCRLPAGPTMSFKVKAFSLSGDVRASLRRPFSGGGGAFRVPAVVVTNNFGEEKKGGGTGGGGGAPHVKLMRLTFQNMFPAVDVTKVSVSRDCRRIVLFNLVRNTGAGKNDEEDELVEVRHYAIRTTPAGISRPIKRIVLSSAATSSKVASAPASRALPNLGRVENIADYVTGRVRPAGSGYATSDTEASGDESAHVRLPPMAVKRGKEQPDGNKAAVKLVELGPRLTLKLFKVERGMCEGDIMYHAYQERTPAEAAAQKKIVKERADLKRRRKEEQQKNVERKKGEKEEKKRKREERREIRRKGGGTNEEQGTGRELEDESDAYEEDSEMDDRSNDDRDSDLGEDDAGEDYSDDDTDNDYGSESDEENNQK
mmetsp:Transcript_3217/g.6668  ORF Transcript_3217/g.6668 Transcript_3217/m.6668 type:complete len:509 (-) Transcript_3217:23-1549(-)